MGLFLQAVEGDCDLRVLKQDGQFSVLFAKCDSSPGRDDYYDSYFYLAERVRKGPELFFSVSGFSRFVGEEKKEPNFLGPATVKRFF